jgi:transcriptional regulator with PAS, ATPase and Fis domain
MLDILETIGRVASTDASILIMGESGTGKELIAEAVHQNSQRRNKPFVKVNLGGISTSLFESEMFGHIRGAFTDARFDRMGRFEMANKGTIFLDEIGDLDAGSQVKLLRVLQDRTYEVLGSSRTKTVDVRVVCATNKNLNDMVARANFREDLLYRINLITVYLPALRERKGDIPLLANYFINNLKLIYNRPELTITPAALKWLQQLPLPGNIRQLKNLVERAVLVSKKDKLDIDDIKAQLDASPAAKDNRQLPGVGSLTLEEMEVEMIKKAMEYHKNRVTKAAQSLGLTRSSLYRRLDKYQIPYDEAED